MDWHSINVSHVINPDLPSAADELEVGKFWMKKLEKDVSRYAFTRI